MSAQRVYLDCNASVPLRAQARAAMLAALELAGNPSSIHAEGRAARALIEEARRAVAALAGGRAQQVVFTSGATESLNLALTPHLMRSGDPRPHDVLLIAAGEHPCVMDGHRFGAATRIIATDSAGRIDLAALREALADYQGQRVMLALQAANGETGVVQPVLEAAKLIHAAGGTLVCDAVQAAGRIPCNFAETGADVMILSSHKIGGPKGAGALVLASDSLHIPDVVLRGGGQERGFRAGTENVAAIAGFGAAAKAVAAGQARESAESSTMRGQFEADLVAALPDAVIFGRDATRLPNTSAFAVPGAPAEVVLMALDLAGYAVSSGSACSSGKVKNSHVLRAMGIGDELARGALRLSLGHTSLLSDVTGFVVRLVQIIETMRRAKTAA